MFINKHWLHLLQFIETNNVYCFKWFNVSSQHLSILQNFCTLLMFQKIMVTKIVAKLLILVTIVLDNLNLGTLYYQIINQKFPHDCYSVHILGIYCYTGYILLLYI